MPEAVLLNEQRDLIASFNRIGLTSIAQSLEEQFANPALYADLSFEKRISRIAEDAVEFEENRSFARLMRRAALPYKTPLTSIMPNEHDGPRREELMMLSQLRYISECRTLFISGPTGSGKTLLSCAAAVNAARKGFSVRYYRMSDLLADVISKEESARARLRERLSKFSLLILDDYGLERISAAQCLQLLNIVAEPRYQCGATIFTSQVKFEAVCDVISDSSGHVKEALTDRWFPKNTVCIYLSGASKRGTEAEIKGVR